MFGSKGIAPSRPPPEGEVDCFLLLFLGLLSFIICGFHNAGPTALLSFFIYGRYHNVEPTVLVFLKIGFVFSDSYLEGKKNRKN